MLEFETVSFWRQFADSPCVLTYLDTHFKDAEALQRALLQEADGSEFPLRQWVEALIVMGQWLGVRGFDLSIEDNLDYVSCVAASAGSDASQSHLPSMVHDLLGQYDCERAV
jgi:hypothetical protein